MLAVTAEIAVAAAVAVATPTCVDCSPIAVAASVISPAPALAMLDVTPSWVAVTIGINAVKRNATNPTRHSVLLLVLHPALLLLLTRELLPAAPVRFIAPSAPRAAKHRLKREDAIVCIWVVVADWRWFFRRCRW